MTNKYKGLVQKTTEFALPRKLRDKWVKALRSGKYKQGKGELYDKGTKSFCCLGVLQHVAMDGKVESFKDKFAGCTHFRSLPSNRFWEQIACPLPKNASKDRKLQYMREMHATRDLLVDANDSGSLDPNHMVVDKFGTSKYVEVKNFKDIADLIVARIKVV